VNTSRFEIACIESLGETDQLGGFDCGEPPRNRWLQDRSLASQRSDDAQTYVGKAQDGQVLGFYALTTGSILRALLPGSLRRNAPDHVSSVLLAQLAVDQRCQGHGLSRRLMIHAMGQATRIAAIAGCRLMIVHPASPALVAYYQNYGFLDVGTSPPVMALSLQNIRITLAALTAR